MTSHLLEELEEKSEWWKDKAMVAEMDYRYDTLVLGEDKG